MKTNTENMKEEELKNKEEELDITIDPEEIVMDDDSDMPEPETKVYEKVVRLTDKFMVLFSDVTGKLPYASILHNAKGDSIKLIDLVKYIEAKRQRISVEEMDKIISFIANIEFKIARPLMELIEDQKNQKILWEQVN